MNTIYTRNIKHQNGFTLVEMLVVIIISSLLLVAAINLYDQYKREIIKQTTRTNVHLMTEAISSFRNTAGRLPCPSDRTLSITSPNFGREYQAGAYTALTPDPITGLENPISDCGAAALALANGTCSSGGGVCRIAGVPGPNGTDILVGGLPVKAIKLSTQLAFRLSEQHALDGWGNQYSYAVSISKATESSAGDESRDGGIFIQDEFGRDLLNGRHAFYTIISHGRDGKGVFNAAGNPVGTACEAPIPAATGADNHNCVIPAGIAGNIANNLDNIFVKSFGQNTQIGANFNDDFVYYNRSVSSALWKTSTISGGIEQLENTNAGNVGVAMPDLLDLSDLDGDGNMNEPDGFPDDPTQLLDVGGDIRLEGNLRVAKLCKGFNCYETKIFTDPTATISGQRLLCGPGEAMIGFRYIGNTLAVTCRSFNIPDVGTDTCSENPPTLLRGITLEGKIICE